jgi:hypothetical protein
VEEDRDKRGDLRLPDAMAEEYHRSALHERFGKLPESSMSRDANLLDDPHHRFHNRRPDFLVISPPKTGSTWLAANLRHHPDIFVPEIKEVRYFNSLYKRLNYEWYCKHFADAGPRLAGEASPSYASLPVSSIRQIRQLLPDLKLVFLMRDPVSRAWSHAKHNRKYGEANFATTAKDLPLAEVPESQWRANFQNEWPLASGDYLGQLRRWASVFPREQLYVGFYESVLTRPGELLREIFHFLGADATIDLMQFPLRERFLSGDELDIPPRLKPCLRGLLRSRSQELAGFLKDNFALETPAEWQTTLDENAEAERVNEDFFERQSDDRFVAELASLEETFGSSYREIEVYRGYNIVYCRDKLYACVESIDRRAIPSMDQSALQDYQARGMCIVGSSLNELKEQISVRILEEATARIRMLESELQAARESIARVSRETAESIACVAAELFSVVAFVNRPSRIRRLINRIRHERQRLKGSMLRNLIALGSLVKR